VSQYPSPYSPPSPYNDCMYAWGQYHALLDPFRRASTLMFILAALGMACGLLVGIVAVTTPWRQLPPELAKTVQRMESEYQMPAKTAFLTFAVLSLLPSLLLATCGWYVRKGSKGATYTSIALAGLMLLFVGLNLLAGLAQSASSPQGVAGVLPVMCAAVVLGAVFVLLLNWLIQAARNVAPLRAAQSQYWHYMRQQQQYAQPSGIGYVTPPASLPTHTPPTTPPAEPQAPAAPPPPPSADDQTPPAPSP